jgi:hypothetical protein
VAWQINGIPWIAEHPWAYPALEVVHIAGIALLLGSLVLLELRVWGAGAASCRWRRWRGWRCRSRPRVLPWCWPRVC